MNDDQDSSPAPGSWFRLSGYGVLIALLEITVAVFFAIDPQCFAGADTGQCIPFATYLWHAGYFIGGVGLLTGLAFRRIDIEVFASAVLIASNVTRTIYGFAYTQGLDSARSITISLLLIVGVSLRVSALLEGGTFILPTWRLRRKWRR